VKILIASYIPQLKNNIIKHMKYLKFLLIGILFGIVLVKSEAVSWYRIYEMFRFQSFHMYGIIGTAIATGILFLQLSKRGYIKSVLGAEIIVPTKENGTTRYIVGGTIFGLGWALIGACPGPLYVLFGTGVYSMLIVIAAAMLGTFIYGIIKHKLPH
jgi:uncharacterized membrane protein YedE/YeeE